MRVWRFLLWCAFVVYLACTAYLVWSPHPSEPGTAIDLVVRAAAKFQLSITPTQVEMGLNVLMFIPLSLIGIQLFRRTSVSNWVLIGFAATLLIESVQRTFLPSRYASSSDIIANTLGALIGAIIGWVFKVVIDQVRADDARLRESQGSR